MFDPTIYDNLKVVLEGSMYDLDAAGHLVVIGREDLVDLATMSRRFQMRVKRPDGTCLAEVQLQSGLLDFAAELQRIRLVDAKVGAHMQLTFWLPMQRAAQHQAIDSYLQEVFGDAVSRRHEQVSLLRTTDEEMAMKHPGQAGHAGHVELSNEADAGQYRILLTFADKVDENNIEDVEPLLLHVAQVLDRLEKGNSFR